MPGRSEPRLPVLLRRLVVLTSLLVALAGCGRHEADRDAGKPVTLEELDAMRDTTGLSRGGAIVRRFEPYRMGNGLIRVRGELALPDGTVLQIALFRPGERWPITRVQFAVQDHRFDSPPIIGPHGPVPVGEYRFELMSFFDTEWQPAEVLRATDDGRDLRGPGITRDRQGRAAFSHTEDRHL